MRSNRFFVYLLTKLLEIRWMNRRSSFLSYCHISVCVILEEVIQVDEMFLPALRGLWWVIGLPFMKSLLVLHMLPIPTIH